MHTNAFRFGLMVASATLALAGCGGGQPSSTTQSQQPAATPSRSDVPGLIAEWDQMQFGERLEQNRYGDRQAPLLKAQGGHVVFTPMTAKDHVSTPFVAVTSGASEVALVLQADAPADDACTATLQDQSFKVLATLPCAGSGEKKATAPVTGETKQVRVFFLSEKVQPQQLPQRIQLIAPNKG